MLKRLLAAGAALLLSLHVHAVPPFVSGAVLHAADLNTAFGAKTNVTDLAATNGASLVGYQSTLAGSVARTMASRAADRVSLLDSGAVCNGSTDDSTVINAQISALSTAGGGEIDVPPGKNCGLANTLVLKPGVIIRGYGATLTWSGSAGIMVQTATTGVTGNVGLEGLTLNAGASVTTVLQLNSAYTSVFRDLTFVTNSATDTVVALLTNTTGATYLGNYNNAENVFQNLRQQGTCGTFVLFNGVGTSGSAGAYVTLNTFLGMEAEGVSVIGIEFRNWSDSNTFIGQTRVNLIANSAIGAIFNSGTPSSSSNGIYNEMIEHLAVDTFTGGGLTGRQGVVVNATKFITIPAYFNDPVAEGGPLTISANALSAKVNQQLGGTTTWLDTWVGSQILLGGTSSLGANYPLQVYGLNASSPIIASVTNGNTGAGAEFLATSGTSSLMLAASQANGSAYVYSNGGAEYLGTTGAFADVFVTNNAEKMRLDSAGHLLVGITSSRSTNASLQTSGPINFPGYTVATLPTGAIGDRAYVTDATACTFMSAPVGGGSTKCPVFYNGTAWVAG